VQTQLKRTVAKTERIRIPFSLGVFEDCTLILQRTEDDTWEGAVAYPEKISIRNEYPYIIPAEVLENTGDTTRLLFYPSSDMIGGVYDGEPTAVLKVTVSEQPDDTVTVQLDLEQYLHWVSDPL
jgi:hypothetical protein